MYRPIDRLGRIVLPIELRRVLDLKIKDTVEIYVEDENIILKKHQDSCVFCESTENLKSFEGVYVCSKCVDEI
jgi:transcriptional pleiotropic regulator of transition state genes